MTKLLNCLKIVTVGILCISFAIPVSAEDTEIYQASIASLSATSRPKVLVIFDNSGSMVSNTITNQLADYDPTITYVDQGFDPSRLYWDIDDTSRYISVDSNRCNSSIIPLNTVGQFQGKAQVWRKSRDTSSTLRWYDLSDSGSRGRRGLSQSTLAMDCLDDEINNDQSNPGSPAIANGYPSESPGPYVANTKSISWGDGSYIFYTANYLNYLNDPASSVTKTRLAIAKDVVTNIVESNPSVDFGLMIFNRNDSGDNNDGGRIIKHLKASMTATERANLVVMVDGLVQSRYTPLCESSYEAYRYLTGQSVQYGLLKNSSDTPVRDPNSETSATPPIYNSPTTDCSYTYIILMTDGAPTNDTIANSAIRTLTNKSSCTGSGGSCLPDITEYMANNDLDGDSTNGDQFAITYTIGFATDQLLLEQAATKGKGEYFTADNSETLTAAFQGAITAILATNESFTSPAVAVDTFSRTESRNEVFFAMFKPSNTVDWSGNIKRLRLGIDGNGDAILYDKDGDPAFDNSTGRISSSATTFWSTTSDGDDVEEGGVGALLAARNNVSSPRRLLSNTNLSGGKIVLDDFDDTYINRANSGYATDAELFTAFDVTDQASLTSMLQWARGIDVDDDNGNDNYTENRPWFLSDMLHSRPLVMNYGARGSFTEANPDQRIFAGTNGGFMHMFNNADGKEDWAFFPKELAPILTKRRADVASTQHVYGIDSPPSTYILDNNGDGTIDSTSGVGGDGYDKAYLYFGLRRGGQLIYALDISNPDSPSFLWQIDDTSPGFSELGQTWSVPTVTYIPGYFDSSTLKPKPVLIFGAGYDTNKDASGLVTPDSMGRGIYIVDATDGNLIWSVTPAINSLKNLHESSLFHSVAANVTVMDSNGDQLTDRLYFADTGGNVWRVDMSGNALPTLAQNTWRITKMASFNGGTASTDRRIFSSPDVVRTKGRICTNVAANGSCETVSSVPFDAIMIGTGDRTTPNSSDVNDQFYMIRDLQLSPYTTNPPSSCPASEKDFRCHLPITSSDLYDATDNLIQSTVATDVTIATAALQLADGWLINLTLSNGEKSLARSLTLDGSVFFTTFAPSSGLIASCAPQSGEGRLYQVNLFDAKAKRDFNNDGVLDRTILLGSLIPETPSPHFGSDKKIRLLFPSGGGPPPLETGATMPQPYGIYWYREEQ